MNRVRSFAAVLLLCFAPACSNGAPDTGNEPSVAGGRTRVGSPSVTVSPSATTPRGDDPPGTQADLEFAVIGDFGARTAEQLAVAGRMCQWHEEHPFEIVVTTGDNVYPDGSPELFEESFFEPYECLFEAGVQWHASLGNHDYITDQGRPNYVVRASGVRFVIANSNALDREWLAQELPAEKGDRWTIVVFHHPVLSPGLHGSTEGFEDLPDLFEKNGVDLVLNGHDHMYAVTKPQDGIRYVVTGGGGADLYPCLPNAITDVCELEHHFLYVEARDDHIAVVAVPAQGPVLDRFTTKGR